LNLIVLLCLWNPLIASDGGGGLLLIVHFWRALIARAGPPVPAASVPGALSVLLSLP